jgi:hypothetical protein
MNLVISPSPSTGIEVAVYVRALYKIILSLAYKSA